MPPLLKKIAVKKITNEKGKSACTLLAVFLTTMLFIVVFSSGFFVMDSLDEITRDSLSWMGDAAFIVTDAQARKVAESSLVSDLAHGFHIGEIMDSAGNTDIELVTYEEKMAQWMKCFPVKGRMPEKGHEIVVSKQYLEKCNLQYQENGSIDITYYVDGTKYTDTFTLTGLYDRDIQSKNVMLFSKDFYEEVHQRLQKAGKSGNNIMYQLIEVIYHSSDIEAATHQLMDEIGFDQEHDGFVINTYSADTGGENHKGIYIILCILTLFVMMIGYLFISNIFSISMNRDIKFYGKLVTNGISETEIKKMILLENNILFLMAVIPALLTGYLFTSLALPAILSSFLAFQIENKSKPLIFILAIAYSWLTLLISSGTSIKTAKNASPVGMKRYMKQMKPVKKCNNKNCLNKFVIRGFWQEKKKAGKIYISIAFSILLANLFYTIVTGFDEQEYISSGMKADYTVADKTFYSEFDARARKNISLTDLAECSSLPGLLAAGGGGRCGINIHLTDIQEKEYEEIVGNQNENKHEPGNMYTYVYGLDDLMVQKMKILDGKIDLNLYHSGQYVIVDTLENSGITVKDGKDKCFHVGDSITIPFQSGIEKTYTVMAVAELPYEISFQSTWMGSTNIFLPFSEWSSQTGISDYYMYTYDVKKEYREQWDETLSSIVKNNASLTYQSAKTLADDSREMIHEIKTAGFILSAILLCMGIMNFVNCMANSIYNKRKEYAIMQSMGTTKTEITGALIKESILYIGGGLLLGCIISVPFTYQAVDSFLIYYSVHYGFYPFIYLMFAIMGMITAILVPLISYFSLDKKEPFLVRIRSCKE